MQFEGKIVFIGDIETVGKNSLQKRTVVLEENTDKEYKGGIAFDLIKDKVTLIESYKLGDNIEVSLNFKTSYYENTGRYYNSITARKISSKAVENEDNHLFPEADEVFPF